MGIDINKNYYYTSYLTDDGIVVIFKDSWPESPREGIENLFSIYIWDKSYKSPDKEPIREKLFSEFNKDDFIYYPINVGNYGYLNISNGKDIEEYKGIAFISKSRCRKEFNIKKITKKIQENLFKILESEIELYNSFIEGNVFFGTKYSFSGEEIDSCSGFYGTEMETNGIYDLFGKNKRQLTIFEIEKLNEIKEIDILDYLKARYDYEEYDEFFEFYFPERNEIYLKENIYDDFFNNSISCEYIQDFITSFLRGN